MSNRENIALTLDENVCDKDQDHDDGKMPEEKPNLTGDRMNLFILFLLNMLQSIATSLIFCLPVLLQKRGATYDTQAQLSFTWWPFAMKLLWAPIIDSCYSARFGRRKTWLIPTQYAIGAMLLYISFHVEDWMGSKTKPTNIFMLGSMLFTLTFLVSVQDVSLDGWALTILNRRNLGYTAICNSIGGAAGSTFGYTFLISLDSADFCNKWLRSEPQEYGMVTIHGRYQFYYPMLTVIH